MKSSSILKQCCGVDVSKDKFDTHFSTLDSNLQIKTVSHRQFDNTNTGFKQFSAWIKKRQNEEVCFIINMEATGVYHEQLAWYLHGKEYSVSIMLPNRSKHFLKALGYESKNDKIDAQGLAQIRFTTIIALMEA